MNPTPKNSSTRVQLPVGLSGTEPPNAPEGGLAYATDTEVVRVKTSTGWEDVGSGGGGGSITTINEGAGIDVTNPTGPVVTVAVDPSEVNLTGDANGPLNANEVNAIHETSGPTQLTIGPINDFQLLQRVGATVVGTAYPPTTLVGDVNGLITANQVNAIHETSGPTQLTIGSITSGQYLQRSGSTLIGATPLTAPTGNPYIDPPATAGVYDDEFDSGSPDLAARGWTVVNPSNVAMTRVGDIDPYDTTLTTTQYRSRLVGSQILIQLGQGSELFAHKSLTTTGALAWIRSGAPMGQGGMTAAQKNLAVGFAAVSGANIDLNNRVYAGTVVFPAGPVMSVTRATAGTYLDATLADGNVHIPDISALRCNGTNTYRGIFANSAAGANTTVPSQSGAINLSTIGKLFINCWCPTATGSTVDSQIFSIDFVRVIQGTANAWIAQTPRPVLWNVVNGNITDYTLKPAPVAADQIYIADSSASNAIKRATISGVGSAVGALNPYLTPPTSPNAFDDEFDSGSADLATRGWTVIGFSTGTAITRGGDILPYQSNQSIAANTYLSTIVNGRLRIQSSVSDILIYKALSGSICLAGKFCRSRSATGDYVFLVYSSAAPYVSSTARIVLVGEDSTIVQAYYVTPPTPTSTVVYTASYASVPHVVDTHVIDWLSGGTTLQLASLDHSVGTLAAYGTATFTSFAPTVAGFRIKLNSTTNPLTWAELDYVRAYPQGTWFPA